MGKPRRAEDLVTGTICFLCIQAIALVMCHMDTIATWQGITILGVQAGLTGVMANSWYGPTEKKADAAAEL